MAQTVTLLKGSTSISPLYSARDTQKLETIKVRLQFTDTNSVKQAKDTIDTKITFSVLKYNLPNNPVLSPDTITVSAARWKATTNGTLDTVLYVRVSGIKDTIQADQVGYVTIKGQTNFYEEIRLVMDDPTSYLHNSSFVSASFIKSIAGTNIPANELLDIFVKLNLGYKKQFFALLSAEAGLGTTNQTDSASGGGKSILNEAMANMNFAFYAKGGDARLARTGFAGAGLKLFYNQAYIGAHFGLLEIKGDLFGSYILGGFYHNPYTRHVALKDSANAGFNYYANNIYLEAGLNILSKSNASFATFFNSIRFKFGLLLPMKSSADALAPRSNDIISRLAVEIPLGIKRF